ncbi:CDP-glycerol glycerophosphotransferase family protein [Anoxybacillus flavithermus]|uniref:Glycosyl/glycerophosphate transferase involved in teichoic acid biosynthesis n=1 Tax=Anoxybacillus flavithermus (strain DSM 21510 / WK1) TaxID=491915 RepID=B7GKZ2_ANOFW|nr:CDP-glycerol glycerophosphotransferase family protein [Anoxybacillus flavithermus]ACJ34929.1 Glycosyl/glycerophosphate transferase involved in teichoic acid biosynthesis [Anoxybacillus flavithermus WK1]
MKKRVLIGSPVHQKAPILQLFLTSLEYLNTEGLEVHYLFIDDNESEDAKRVLLDFVRKKSTAYVLNSANSQKYICDENTHYWNEGLVWKVAHFKNIIIQFALEKDFDYLFFIDSDIVLHPETLQKLIEAKKDIISNIFWTKWQPDLPELPQVWVFDQYGQYYYKRGEKLTKEQIQDRHQQFLDMLRKPGIYEVGGLGACTLISRRALQSGVSFSEIKNVSFWGEDRHFCIRAQALGFDLFVDTHYPAFHIYRDSDKEKAEEYMIRHIQEKMEKELFYKIKVTFESIGSFDYKKGYEDLLTSYFSNQMRQRVLDEIQTQLEDNIKSKLQVKASVYRCKVKEINLKEQKVIVTFVLENNGKYKDDSFYEAFLCESEVIKEGNEWFINSLVIVDKIEGIDYTSQPVGYVVNKKKNISLVYTNLSGMNTVALYKLIPENIKDEFNVKLIKQNLSSEYFKQLMDSDVVVVTEGNYLLNKKELNKSQLVVDTWHGFPLKAMGFVDKGEKYKDHINKVWENVDIIASYSKLFNCVMNQCINTDPNKYIVTGSPRNDFLYLSDGKRILSQMMGLDLKGKRVLLYMPTYRFASRGDRRDGDKKWSNIFGMEEFCYNTFARFLKENDLVLLIKLHPAEEAKVVDSIQENESIFILRGGMLEENYVDLYEVVNAADLLITDYSSIYFDYLLLDRPIIFVPADLVEYENTRGFLLEPYDRWTPGPKVLNQACLEEQILKSLGDYKYYKAEREYLSDLVHFYKDSRSSERLWKVIIERLSVM